MSVPRILTAGALALALSLAPAHAAHPPAAEVKANVHAAATLTIAELDQTPSTGTAAALEVEAALVQGEGASGLGEIMGWGQDYWDDVEPAITAEIVKRFQEAFKVLSAAFESTTGLTWARLHTASSTLRAHFQAMQRVVAGTAPEQKRRELATLASLAAHQLREIPDSPAAGSAEVKQALAIRTLHAAVTTLSAELAQLPAIAGAVQAHIATLKALAATPPATPAALAERAVPALGAIAKAAH